MIQSLNILIISLLATTTMTILLMFLPAIIELKKPKDAGPRLIIENFAKIGLSTLKIQIINIEDDWKLDIQSTMKIASFLHVIPNLEA
jgi:hypothetical protein